MKKFFLIVFGIIVGGIILGLNIGLFFPWFLGKGPANIGSIEVSYVSMGRFLRDYYPHLSFGPFWYFGFPFHLFYTPLLPVLETILNKSGGIPLWQTYRIISGAGLVLAPVSLFLFVWYISKKMISGVIAGLSYSFLPSLFYYVLPSKEVAMDVFNSRFLDPRRLVILARWGEGPHTLSLFFLPLAGLFYFRVLKSKKLSDMVLAAFFIGLTALTNAIGFYALVILLLAIFFGHLTGKRNKIGEALKTSIPTAIISYGLIAFWYNLSFMSSFFGEGGGALKNYIYLFPWGYILLFFVTLGIYYFFRKVVKRKAIALSFVWFLILFLIVYVYYTSAPPEFAEKRLEFAPQALRLITASDMAFSVFLAVLVGGLISFLEKKGRILKIFANLLGIGLIVGLLSYGFSYFPYGRKVASGEVDLTKTGEYEIANWLKENVDTQKGERVYVAGNYGFYLNYFTDIWQLRGGLYQARTHPWPDHIYFQINNGKDSQIALSWLKAGNIKYIVVNTPASRELYKENKYLQKFADLDIAWEEKGDIVYKVPLKATNPAKVVDIATMGSLTPPKKADDKNPLLAYVDWLDQSKPAEFKVINNNLYQIEGRVNQNEGILVQMTYDKGFKARSNQGKIQIKKDPLGFMVLIPPKEGDYQIELSHHPTWKIWLGYLITLSTIIGLVFASKRRIAPK